jgi:hypothetical protein
MPKTQEEALKIHDQTVSHLVEQGRLVLTVEVESQEQAEQILQWMYAPEKPMKATLVSLGWNQEAVSSDVLTAIRELQSVLANNQI